MKYQKPEMEYIGFEDCDIVTASGGPPCSNDTPIFFVDPDPGIDSFGGSGDF